MRQTGHLTPELALQLKRIVSQEVKTQPEMRKDLESYHIDCGILYLLWSLLPERVLLLPSAVTMWFPAIAETSEEEAALLKSSAPEM